MKIRRHMSNGGVARDFDRIGVAFLLIVFSTFFGGACTEGDNSRTTVQDFDNACPQAPSALDKTACDDLDTSCDSSEGVEEGCAFVRCSCGYDVTGIDQVWNCASLECEEDDADDADAEEPNQCLAPPSELEAVSCGAAGSSCRTAVEAHVCCAEVFCGCRSYPGRDGLTWVCSNIGCAETAEECPAICDLDPNAPFCPPPNDDATDGDAIDAAAVD